VSTRSAWVDASAGIAGDMLLGALVDAGADLEQVQSAVDAVLPGSARLVRSQVSRSGMRATKVDVEILIDDPPHRSWSHIKDLLDTSALPGTVRDSALHVFSRLAAAEAHVHGLVTAQVHFHEIGAIDSIVDIVGVCTALDLLGVSYLSGGSAAVGSGRMNAAHGDMAIPGPAVTELARGWTISSGGPGELATPTGMALLTALSDRCEELPTMTVGAVGVGAGSRDTPGRANVTRVLLATAHTADIMREDAVLLETNIDDLDPRIWPNVLAALLGAGAADAWLVPIIMKKGRPAHTLTVLAPAHGADALRTLMFDHTSTFGVRQTAVQKYPLERGWIDVLTGGTPIPVKIAHRSGVVTRATPEFEDVAALAAALDRPVLTVLDEVRAAAAIAGIRTGAPVPESLSRHHDKPHPDPEAAGSAHS
jgi:uncharacterized protein (TIGR00299 family) protein